ncbi:alkaline phosphatase PhoX [Actinacidiphila epipremni]|uniref:alkaline phosphatase PhoX n=1 Tax=Actinacidiphila epipremni TaxID=2053013 RepID=UPI0038993EDD
MPLSRRDAVPLLTAPAGAPDRALPRTGRPRGSTPWGTWLTCDETGSGHVVEVEPYNGPGGPDDRRRVPLKALGRCAPTAVAVDPRRGHLYLTEDAAAPAGLLYRWTPPRGFAHGPGKLAQLGETDGHLQAFRCFDSAGRFVADLSRPARTGVRYGVDWIDVPDRTAETAPVRAQFTGDQVTRACGLADMWWADGGVYVVVSSGAAGAGPRRRDGSVWFYDPSRRTLALTALPGSR